jgi:hypothetical protein
VLNVRNGAATYQVQNLVATAAAYRLYICQDMGTRTQFLLQIAADVEFNGGLDRAAFLLQRFQQASDRFEAAFAQQDQDRKLLFDQQFPQVVDSFVCQEQGKRRINILSLKDVEGITAMAPLSNLRIKDRKRIDLKTSAWIMGRLLKLLMFSHSQGVAVRLLADNNVLIGPARHRMTVLDWSAAFTYQHDVPEDARRSDIALAASVVFAACGGIPETGGYPYDSDESDNRYITHLRGLIDGTSNNAETAYHQFYELVRDVYGDTFHPFTTLPI